MDNKTVTCFLTGKLTLDAQDTVDRRQNFVLPRTMSVSESGAAG